MSGHTLGPWKFREYLGEPGDIELLRSIGKEPTRALNNDGSAVVMSESGRVACVDLRRDDVKKADRYGADDPERDANARLIAAAPTMLEALSLCLAPLKVAYECREENGMPVEASEIHSIIRQVEAAIAQAQQEGGQ